MLKSSFTCCRTSKHQLFPWRKHKVTMQSYFAIFPHLEPASFSSCHLRWIKNSLLSHAIPSLHRKSDSTLCFGSPADTLKAFLRLTTSPHNHQTIQRKTHCRRPDCMERCSPRCSAFVPVTRLQKSWKISSQFTKTSLSLKKQQQLQYVVAHSLWISTIPSSLIEHKKQALNGR